MKNLKKTQKYHVVKGIFISIYVCVFIFGIKNIVYAEEIETNDTAITEAQLEDIKFLENKLKTILDDIEIKFEKINNSTIYTTYPAVRLNVDTPMFGLTEIIENKLRIKENVTSNEIKDKYSVKNVVESSYVIIPDNIVQNVVVKTKKVTLNSSILSVDFPLIISSLDTYCNQAEEVNNFLDEQITKIFLSYVTGGEQTYINNINKKVTENEKLLKSIIEDINILRIKNTINLEFEESYTQELIVELLKYKKVNNNYSVFSLSDLKKIENDLEKLRVKIYNFSYYINSLEENNKEYNLLNILTVTLNDMTERATYINEYIESSVKESKLIYSINSKDTETKIKEIIERIEQYKEQVTIKETNPERAKTDESIATMNYDKILEEVKKEYVNYINIVNDFYNSNIDLLNTNSKNKLIAINKYSDKNINSEIVATYVTIEKSSCTVIANGEYDLIYILLKNNKCLNSVLKEELINNLNISQIYQDEILNINENKQKVLDDESLEELKSQN